eukprot:CAMPEP_0202908714 /NCGR_PEP_ID=MMETSP1392-20130828/46994_1 /ASSEMBLY_ACC=CAM_ASM_000868 /TAXON_ID=225041 /ORGANISM="Chlamydomonas chlamydogama, Strain SAG 11-48b" /LENGTH=271 /DNA_ID=CAMNT_0049598179 /DNA_START=106 /DNA_END=917 /DNA_ORIENTATION=-
MEYTKLPSLLRTLEGRSSTVTPLVGSSILPQVAQKDQNSPTAGGKTPTFRSFETAKKQVDRDLEVLKEDAQALYDRIGCSGAADIAEQQNLVVRLIDIVDECLESSIDDFKLTVTDIVDSIEEDRSMCDNRQVKALYTRLLFILTRCSRLLITEQLNLFATEPRNQRYSGMAVQRVSVQQAVGLPDDDDPLFRCHTMPVKAMYDMIKKLHSSPDSGNLTESNRSTPVTGEPNTPHNVTAREDTSSTTRSSNMSPAHLEAQFEHATGGLSPV